MDSIGTALVADDNPERLEALAALVTDLGFTALKYTDATAAREFLHTRPDLDAILCEMDMEGLSWSFAERTLREMDVQIPVILFSDQAEASRMMRALRVGASDFFVRPVDDVEALRRSLDRCVRQRQVRRELEESRRSLQAANTELTGTIEMLEKDQQAGRQVQLRMLPASPLVLGDYVFSHTVIPSLYLSGDFTDYFIVGEHFVTFFMADVSGHGSSSAFATVLLKNLFARKRSDFLRRSDDTILSPVALLKRANQELMDLEVGKFATMVVGVLDLEHNSLRYSVAGHLPQPVLVSEDGARYLRGEGSAVGILEDASYEEHMIDLPASFMLALFSDGILEILPPKNLIEKEKYFLNVFEETANSPEEMVTRLGLDQVDTAPDDIAALFISKRG
ncbi:response regulator [Seongchinamella sediminis]|uniref:Response regulator n=1 Tax=Seongchinamella sediminis TaxID=2283635 RepID=A0A3L7E0B5_9GAMM|nr:SpoIIE family protein phosphatase [Seongchinamella sediminis]RLQ23208.1 response regulator [Seongchinamella sediminis]